MNLIIFATLIILTSSSARSVNAHSSAYFTGFNGALSYNANTCSCFVLYNASLSDCVAGMLDGQEKAGYRVPVTIPGVYHGLKTIYISDIRESKLSILSATQFLDAGWRLRYREHGITFFPPSAVSRIHLTIV